MHTKSALAGAGGTVVLALGVFFAVSASNAQAPAAPPVEPTVAAVEEPVVEVVSVPGRYSTLDVQDPIADPLEYVVAPAPEPEPTPVEEPVSQPAPKAPAPAPAQEPAPAPQPAPEPVPQPDPLSTPPANLDIGPPPPLPPDSPAPGGTDY